MVERQITFDWILLFGIRNFLEERIKEMEHLRDALIEEYGEDHEKTMLVKEKIESLKKQLERVNDGINS